MRRLIVKILSLISILYLSGCVQNSVKDETIIDESLPVVNSIKTIVDMNSVAFEWAVVSSGSVSGFHIYRKDINSELFTRVGKIDSKYATHYVDLGLHPNSEYIYKFTTFTQDGRESIPSVPIEVETLNNFEPVSFVTTISNMPRRIKVLWRPHTNSRVGSYIIERVENGMFKEIAKVDGRLQVEYIDSELSDGVEYEYRVVAKSFDSIYSLPSATVKATTKRLPPKVESLNATTTMPKKILLSWSKSNYPDFDHYRIYASNKPNEDFSSIAKTKNIEFLDTINEDGKEMFYKVAVVDNDNLESPLQVDPVMGVTLHKPEAPTIDFVTVDEGSILIRWSNFDSRVVEFIINKEAKEGLFNTKKSSYRVPSDQLLFRDSEVKEDVKYTYTIQSVDNYGIISQKSKEYSHTIVPIKR
jgi:fibronectin type 3 domain-containing protein